MGLRETIQAAAALAFQAAGNLVVSKRVRHTATPTYNATTDTQSIAWAFDQDVELIGYHEDADEAPEADNPDMKLKTFVFLGSALEIPLTAEAEVDDGGVTWKSYKIERDPAEATVLIYCRA